MILRGILETSSEKFWMKIGKVVVLGEIIVALKIEGTTVKMDFTQGLTETSGDFYGRVIKSMNVLLQKMK